IKKTIKNPLRLLALLIGPGLVVPGFGWRRNFLQPMLLAYPSAVKHLSGWKRMDGNKPNKLWVDPVSFSEAEGKLIASLDVKSRITRHHFTADGKQLFLASTSSQPPRKDGKWPDYGEIKALIISA